jgi:hypothetical protein
LRFESFLAEASYDAAFIPFIICDRRFGIHFSAASGELEAEALGVFAQESKMNIVKHAPLQRGDPTD